MIYAVNKRTKEHRIHTPGYPSSLDEEFVEATPDGWIPWEGGECPLPDNHACDVKTKHGRAYFYNAKAVPWAFIIAYRPILDANTKPESPAWDGEGLPPVGCEVEARMSFSRWVDVRVLYHHKRGDEAVVVALDESQCGWADEFRPIRSEEDRAVDALESVMASFPYGDTKRELAELAYDAIRDGKIPGVKLENT